MTPCPGARTSWGAGVQLRAQAHRQPEGQRPRGTEHPTTCLAQPAPVVDLTADVGDVPERAASQASTFGREGSQGSESSAPTGEPIQARQRPPSRVMRINDQRVYRRADTEMVDLAGDSPVCSVDYFTTAVTPRYLPALREEFRILDDVDLMVPGESDLPSRLPLGYITLSVEYFRARLRLPFHPYLRRALH
ncbi:hypothetical protein TIFTF001_049704 [Ficus carica]|uniref:Uncharacterized protein n=1 Tax=Ficus carica TaxID=3494 RepID=A0AA88CU02_FICCA|nr:hypothetical protein TIFTF001_049702 [Ficus carica]GMN31640.1 hypothetical protein TIFTF001_049704 [Ficus carica]